MASSRVLTPLLVEHGPALDMVPVAFAAPSAPCPRLQALVSIGSAHAPWYAQKAGDENRVRRLAAGALPWHQSALDAAAAAATKTPVATGSLVPLFPSLHSADCLFLALLSTEARFMACMMLFALAVQRTYMSIESAARFKDPDVTPPLEPFMFFWRPFSMLMLVRMRAHLFVSALLRLCALTALDAHLACLLPRRFGPHWQYSQSASGCLRWALMLGSPRS